MKFLLFIRSRNLFRSLLSLFALLLALAAPTLSAALLPGNLLPNPTLESDVTTPGAPDFWNRGGSDLTIDLWSSTLSVSPTHSLQLNDTSTVNYGEWYSNPLAILGGTNYQLRYNLFYVVTNVTPMRVTVNFYNAANTLFSSLTYSFSGNHNFWEEITQSFVAPAAAVKLSLSFTSGGTANVTGQAWLDDISLAPATLTTSLVPYIENFPPLPTPLVIRNWKQTATDYSQLAFNSPVTGQFLPLLYIYNANTTAGFSGSAFSLPSYVGNPADSGEGITVLGGVLGATLAGINMASLNGVDRVQQCEVFYSIVNGHGLVLNNLNSSGTGSAWYDLFPSTLFYEIGSRYPGRPTYQAKMQAIADSWLSALPILSNNFNHTDFNFSTMTPSDNGQWIEPDMAAGIGWLEYMAYLQFNAPKYLAGADACLTSMNTNSANPLYEVMELFGPILSARMDAELGRTYSTSKHLNWLFNASSDARPGWGCESGQWGAYDAYGLMGSTTDTSGYAFSLNTYTAAGLIAPVVRYQPQYARLLGRWLLHVAANANLFYPGTLATNMESNASWVQQTGVQSVSYEGVRNLGTTTPYSTGDANPPILDLNPYGAWGSGWLGALFQTSNVPGILQIDCRATEAFPPAAWPTYLFYNPYTVAKSVTLNTGSGTNHLYDAVTGLFLATNVTGTVSFTLPPDTSIVLVQCPATGAISQSSNKLLIAGTVIDYANALRDTDTDGLPDWWESRYFGTATNASPLALAANGFNNLQCYQLGLDPTDPHATFAAQAIRQPATGYPQISWNTIGGKTYTVQYANSLATYPAFTNAVTVTETNVPPGAPAHQTFVDTSTQTAPPNARYYRIKLVLP